MAPVTERPLYEVDDLSKKVDRLKKKKRIGQKEYE